MTEEMKRLLDMISINDEVREDEIEEQIICEWNEVLGGTGNDKNE